MLQLDDETAAAPGTVGLTYANPRTAPCTAEEARWVFLLEEPSQGAESWDSCSQTLPPWGDSGRLDSGTWSPAMSAALPTLELPFDWGGSADELAPLPRLPQQGQEQTVEDTVPMSLAGSEGEPALVVVDCAEVAATPRSNTAAEPAQQGVVPWQSHGSGGSIQLRPPSRRPAGLDQDALLRLLAETYGRMMLSSSGRGEGPVQEEQLDGWLQQLRDLVLSGDSDTVLALYTALKAQHSWAQLGDVYSALVGLRDRYSRQL